MSIFRVTIQSKSFENVFFDFESKACFLIGDSCGGLFVRFGFFFVYIFLVVALLRKAAYFEIELFDEKEKTKSFNLLRKEVNCFMTGGHGTFQKILL